jgi:hypothetical protein
MFLHFKIHVLICEILLQTIDTSFHGLPPLKRFLGKYKSRPFPNCFGLNGRLENYGMRPPTTRTRLSELSTTTNGICSQLG